MRRTLRLSRRFLVISAVGFLAGCSSSGPADRPKLTDVSGVVLLDGAPVANATVEFAPVSKQRGAFGRTDDQGNFVLRYVDSNGCPLGEHQVRISTVGNILDDNGNIVGMQPESIPEKYNVQTTLTETVMADGENVFAFALSSE